MDYIIRKFKADLINMINESILPIEVKRMVLSEVEEEARKKADEIVAEQLEKINTEKNITESDNVESEESEDGN